GHAAPASVNKLGKKGEEEECDLRIEQVGDHSLAKDRRQRVRREMLFREMGALRQHLDAEIDQVGGAGVANHGEGKGRRAKKSGDAEGGGQNVAPAADKDAQ